MQGVTLDCGSQDINALQNPCSLNGNGASPLIGDLNFNQVKYNPQTNSFEGKIQSFVGDFDMNGIQLFIGSI